jgi:4-amino-4-deoxy-L-arabinose transferase-like glycosyltransferase
MPEGTGRKTTFFRRGTLLERCETAAFFVLVTALSFWALGDRDLWKPDETRHAQVAREMTVTGDYLVPRLNGEPYPEKGPLYFWLVAAVGKAHGAVDAFSARVPSAVSVVALTALVFLLARRWFSPAAEFWSACTFAFSPVVLFLGHWAGMDLLFTLWVTLACFLMAEGYAGFGAPETKSDVRVLYGWLFAGLAVLVKGPVGLLLPFLVVAVFLLLRGRLQRVSTGWTLAGLLVATLVPGVWFLPAVKAAGPQYYFDTTLGQFLKRATDAEVHAEPWYFYLWEYPILLLPWFFFLPGAAAMTLRAEPGPRKDRLIFLWTLAGVMLLFFSIPASKGPLYLLPTVPAIAMILGHYWAERLEEERLGRGARGLVIPAACFAAFFAVAVWVGKARITDPEFAALADARVGPLPAAFAVGGIPIALLGFSLFGKGAWRFLSCALVGPCLLLLFLHWAVPRANPRVSNRAFLEQVSTVVGREAPFFVYELPGHTTFYLDRCPVRVLHEPTEVARALEESDTTFALMGKDDFDRFRQDARFSYVPPMSALLGPTVAGGRQLVLVKSGRRRAPGE